MSVTITMSENQAQAILAIAKEKGARIKAAAERWQGLAEKLETELGPNPLIPSSREA